MNSWKIGRVCMHCYTPTNSAGQPVDLKCGACFTVMYCNKACQEADWESHKYFCKEIKALSKLPEGQERHEKTAILSEKWREKALFDIKDPFKLLLISNIVTAKFGPKKVRLLEGKETSFSPEAAHPNAHSATRIELTLRRLIWTQDIRICYSKAKEQLVSAIQNLSAEEGMIYTICGILLLFEENEIPAVWKRVFENLCAEDPKISLAVNKSQKILHKVRTTYSQIS